MATETFKLENGDTLEVTTTEERSVVKEVVDKTIVMQKVSKKIIPGIPTPANKLPMVSAGTDQTIKLPVSEVTLTGVVSDSDGTIQSVKWEKTVGGTATIANAAELSTKVTALVEGTYMFRLTATDDKGGQSSDDLIVKVLPADVVTPPGKVNYITLPLSGPLDYSGKSNQVIENKRITNAPGVALKLYSGANNITIRNCFFDGAAGELVELENASNITIENCLFARGLAGVYALGSKGIKIKNCQFVNMRARYVNGLFAGRGVFAQFNSCSDIEITDCKGENFQNESDPEDMVSFFASSNGVVRNCMFRGGGPSSSGGGIICGDNGGNNVMLENNTLLNPGQYGMAIAGGTNMKILNNKIYSEQKPWSNNPLYVWAQGNQVGISSNATVKGNQVHWVDRNGAINNGWNAGNISNTAWEDPTSITLAEMNVPDHLIDFVTPAELLTIRK